jgi:hypothetical protein
MTDQRGFALLDSIVRIGLMLGVVLIVAWMFTGASGPSRADIEALTNMQMVFGEMRERMQGSLPYEDEPAVPHETLGLEAPESYRYGMLASAEVIDGGRIRFTFDKLFDVENAQLVYTPVRPGPRSPMVLRWNCTSPNIEEVESYYPRCTYKRE